MDGERWRLIDHLFAAALDLPPRDRPAFLDEACGGDAELRSTVERLLAADADPITYLERPVGSLLEAPPGPRGEDEVDPPLGARLGPYTLLRVESRGGMGTVYLATRNDGLYDNRVAIKVLHRGLAGTEHKHRFRAERQILARLEHPNIARLHDGGTLEDGRPYLVMEFVEGLPIDRYCELHNLGIDARLSLFRRVCAAVQYAHQNLLVHRDLKPANILVTADGEPKLLDFGIAKQLGPGEAHETRTGLRVMTPGYASPEQVRGEAVSTVSDVYSLGVVLYELLVGRSPYRVTTGGSHELERAVCDQEPERPSTAVRRDLRRRLRGDLDAITLTALRKEPGHRYGSAEQLAQDVERHQSLQPVMARRGARAYRTSRFLLRHRFAVAGASLAAALVLGLLVVLAIQVQRTGRERDKARHALEFLVDVFRTSDPYRTGGERVTARNILDNGAGRLARELDGEPQVQAALLDAIGQAYLGLGRPDDARPLLEKALRLRRQGPGLDQAASEEHLADLKNQQGDYPAALALYETALDRKRRLLDDGDPEVARTLIRQGAVFAEMNRHGEAVGTYRQALAIYRRQEGEGGGAGVAETLAWLGRLEHNRGRYAEAERYLQQALKLQRKVLGLRHPEVARTLSRLSVVRVDAGRLPAAEALLRQALAIQRQALEPGHPDLVDTLNNLALALHYQGSLEQAEALYREALGLYRARLGDEHPVVADALNNVGAVVQALGRTDEAIHLHEEALALRQRIFGERHVNVAQSLVQIARAHWATGHLDEAAAHDRRAVDMLRALLGARHPLVAYPLTDLGRILSQAGRLAEAEGLLRESLAIRVATLAADHFEIARVRGDLAECLTLQGRYKEAEPLLLTARDTLSAQFPPLDKRVVDTRKRLATLYRAWGREAEARVQEAGLPGISK